MKKILVVDDDTDILVSLKNVLTRSYYDVAVTLSCSEGLDTFYKFKPDLVIQDIKIGNEDGCEMCKIIKEQADFKHIPVILFSADYTALEKYNDYYANDTIKKPFEVSAILALIKIHLEKSKK